jgi:hypothetical protein
VLPIEASTTAQQGGDAVLPIEASTAQPGEPAPQEQTKPAENLPVVDEPGGEDQV